MSTPKRKKGIKNSPMFYDEIKERKVVYLTKCSWLGAKEKALKTGLSASEYIERLIRKDLDECD